MQHNDSPPLPPLRPGWRLGLGGYYHWTDPKEDDSPDAYIERSGEEWEIEYWVKGSADWIRVRVPLTPDPPFELAEALYYAAQ